MGGWESTKIVTVVILGLQSQGSLACLFVDFPDALQCGDTEESAALLSSLLNTPKRLLEKYIVINIQFIGNLVGDDLHQNLQVPTQAVVQHPFCALVSGKLFFLPVATFLQHHLLAALLLSSLASQMPCVSHQLSSS